MTCKVCHRALAPDHDREVHDNHDGVCVLCRDAGRVTDALAADFRADVVVEEQRASKQIKDDLDRLDADDEAYDPTAT